MMIQIPIHRDLSTKMPPGLDLSGYGDEIKNQFEARTNELRRTNYTNSPFQMNGNQDHNSNSNSLYGYNFCRSSSMNSLSNHFVDNQNQISESIYSPNNIADAFQKYNQSLNNNNLTNNGNVVQIFNEIIKSGNENEIHDQKNAIDHCLLTDIANDESVVREILEMYSILTNLVFNTGNQEIPQPLVFMYVIVMQTISVLFKWGDIETQNQFADEMTLSFNSILQLPQIADLYLLSSTNDGLKAIIKAVLNVIIVFSHKSEYARNCLVCFGVQSTIADNITNIMRVITSRIQNNYNIFADLNNMSDIVIEIQHMICSGLKEIFAYTDKFNDWNINGILDIFIELVRLGIENGNTEQGIKEAQLVLANCFSNGLRSIPFIIKETAFDCLTSITNHKLSNSVFLCEKGLHLTLLNILKMSITFFLNNVLGISDPSKFDISTIDQSLISTASSVAGSNWGKFVSSLLKLIGNTASSQPKASTTLIENGLVQLLMTLIQLKNCFCANCTSCSCIESEFEYKNCQSFMSDAFWILSNMLRIVPEILIPLIPSTFVQFALSQAIDAPVGIKREISFFLATCVLCFNYNRVGEVFSINNENGSIFFELMDEMISSGRNDIATRCIDSMINLTLLLSSEEPNSLDRNQIMYLLGTIEENGIMKDLEELIEEGEPLLANRATSLYNQILRLSSRQDC